MRYVKGMSWLFVCLLGLSGIANANPDLSVVIKQHLDSRGGYDRVCGLQRYEMKGTVTRDGKTQPMRAWWKYPNKLRVDIGTGDNLTTSIFDGETAWVIESEPWGKEPVGMPPGFREIFTHQADFAGPLSNPEKHGVKVVPDSKTWGDAGYLFKIECGNGNCDQMLLDPGTRLAKSETYQIGSKEYAEQRFSRYRRTEGFAVPGHIERFIDGKLVEEIDITEFTIGPEIAESIFAVQPAKYDDKPAPNLVDLTSLADLRQRFVADAGHVRLVAFLSPTSPEGRRGFMELQEALKNINDERLRAYVVWTGVLDSDKRSAAAARANEIQDPRVVAFWDQKQAAVAEWSEVVSSEHPVWNSYFVNGPTATWDAKPPVPDLWLKENASANSGLGPASVNGFSPVRDMLASLPENSKSGKGSNSRR